MRKNDLVKFIGHSVCKFMTACGTEDVVVEDDSVGIILSVIDPIEYGYPDEPRCEVLIGNEVFYDVSLEDLSVIQQGVHNVI